MRTQRQQPATRVLLVLVVVLGSLWAGGWAAPTAADALDRLAASRAELGGEPATLRGRTPALRATVDRPSQNGHLEPLLLGLLATSLTVASGVPARRRHPSLAPARSPVLTTLRSPRAPPRLQPA
jgi:hypothetical protein